MSINMDAAQAAENESHMTDGEDDPVVRRIQVYLNRIPITESAAETANENLTFLLQYPLRPVYRPYGDQGRLVVVKFRPQQKMLQFQYELNMDSENFDSSKRAEIFEAQSMGQPAQGKTHILTSMPCVSPHSSYGLGLLKDDKFYITPVSSILQFRPDFSYIDADMESSKRRAAAYVSGETQGSSDKGDDKKSPAVPPSSPESVPTTAPPIPPETERHRYPPSKIRDAMLAEPWVPVDSFFDPDSPESHELIQLLTSYQVPVQSNRTSHPEDPAIELSDADKDAQANGFATQYERVSGGKRVQALNFSSDFESYIDQLCNLKNDKNAAVQAANSSGPLNYLSLCRLSIDQQVLRILQHRHAELTSKIASLVTQQIEEADLVNHIRNYADLIRGVWVCRSHLVYDGLVALCRDVLIFLMANGKPIVRESVKPHMGTLSMEKLTEILKELAVYKNNAWYFKHPDDKRIQEQYPQLAKEAAEKFSKQNVAAIIEKIKGISNAQALAHKAASGSGDKATSSNNALGLIDSSTLNKALSEALRLGCHRVEALLPAVQQSLRQQANDLQPTSQRLLLSTAQALTTEDLSLVLPRLGDDIGMGYWALRKTGSPQIDRHREVIIDIYKKHTLHPDSLESRSGLSRSAIEAEFQARRIKFDLPDFTFRQLMKEFAVNQRGYWIFKGFVEDPSPTSKQELGRS